MKEKEIEGSPFLLFPWLKNGGKYERRDANRDQERQNITQPTNRIYVQLTLNKFRFSLNELGS